MKKHSTMWVGFFLIFVGFASGILFIALPGIGMVKWQISKNREEELYGLRDKPHS